MKLLKIDESQLQQYPHLVSSDHCYFLVEYASHCGFDYSPQNQIIFNFKKPMDKKGKNEWYYKELAILEIAHWLTSIDCWQKLITATWVPMPPSKIKSDPEYDDRLLRVLSKMKEFDNTLDVQELLLAKSSREAAHNRGVKRRTVQEYYDNLAIAPSMKSYKPRGLILFDDVLTTGAQFNAAQMKLREEFPDTPIVGLFVARTVKSEIDFSFQ